VGTISDTTIIGNQATQAFAAGVSGMFSYLNYNLSFSHFKKNK
jgi:hypothetical protein